MQAVKLQNEGRLYENMSRCYLVVYILFGIEIMYILFLGQPNPEDKMHLRKGTSTHWVLWWIWYENYFRIWWFPNFGASCWVA